MVNLLKYAGVALIIFLILDAIWLGVIAKNLYKNELGELMREKPNWLAAGIFYVIFIAGLTFFVIGPAITDANFAYAILAGLFFGFVTYATYDLTNLATLQNFPVNIVLIDLVWGAAVASATSTLTYIIFT